MLTTLLTMLLALRPGLALRSASAWRPAALLALRGGHRWGSSPVAAEATAAAAGFEVESTLVNGVRTRSHVIPVPLDHSAPNGEQVDVFVREVLLEKHEQSEQDLPCLLYLQGGPGFPAGRPTFPLSGWMARAAAEGFRILLLDQRGTGMSTPVTPVSLERLCPADLVDREERAAWQAAYLAHFRADSIVHDCEVVREAFGGGKLTLLGQSFGGFVILTYLSLFPQSLERCLFTFGLAPVLRSAEEVYRATYERMRVRNQRFYQRYPQDVGKVLAIARFLQKREAEGDPVALPSGGRLTVRRFQMSGLALGSLDGLERLHFLLEDAWAEVPAGSAAGAELSTAFLHAMDALHAFETNPLYWLLHEAIYVDGPGSASRWAAARVQHELPQPSPFDATHVLSLDGTVAGEEQPLYLTGEMVFDWLAEDFSALAPLQRTAELLAQRDDWPALYNRAALANTQVPCAALISYDDIYVERAFSEETAALLGPKCKLWISNEFQHSGLRDCPVRVFDTLLGMAKAEIALPS